MPQELPARTAQKLSQIRVKDPEKRALREKVDARNAVIQERGVPAPASGTYGKPK
jgi:hypothetical protein